MMASIVISRNVNGKVAITAIGPYKGTNKLVINTTADSPGKPIYEKTGFKKPEIQAITPQYCRKLTNKLIGSINFNNHQTVFLVF